MVYLLWTAILLGHSVNASEDIGARAQILLRRSCYSCHGDPNEKVRGGFSFVLDFQKLRSSEFLNLNRPERSRLYELVSTEEMPAEGPPLTSDEKAILLDWIKAGAPDPVGNTPPPQIVQPAEVDEILILKKIQSDLRSIPFSKRLNLRYFLLGHLKAVSKNEDYELAQSSLNKLLNSLSWTRSIRKGVWLDSGKTILRIDLSDYGWTRLTWDKIIAANPYSYQNISPEIQDVYVLTTSQVPYVRADWFVHAAAEPPLYYDILELPRDLGNFERKILIDSVQNVANRQVIRSGFRGGQFSGGSGVSQNNRMIERHELPWGGYYWKSFDFSNNVGVQDLFQFPLSKIESAEHFEEAGGEMIFSLPNGLQGYFIANSQGKRLDEAPINIVQDPTRLDGKIFNGISCMSCHNQGIKSHSDQVLNYSKDRFENGLISANDWYQISAYYSLSPESLAAVFENDSQLFIHSLQGLGVNPQSAVEPIRYVFDDFEKPLSIERVSYELGLLPEDFKARAEFDPRLFEKYLQLQRSGITREEFITLFHLFVDSLDIGRRVRIPYPPNEDLQSVIDSIERCEKNTFFDLIEQKPNLWSTLFNSNDLILTATQEGCEKILEFLLSNGTLESHDRNVPVDGRNQTPLHIAVQKRLLQVIRIFAKWDLNTDMLTRQDHNGRRPLDQAILLRDPELVRALVEYQNYQSLAEAVGGRTLIDAVITGNVEIVRLLLGVTGVEINYRDQNRKTALGYAYQLARENPIERSYFNIVEMLRAKGAIP